MFCVVCAKEWPLDELRHGTCPECYLVKNTLASIKEHVDVEACVHCLSRKRGEVWVEGHGSLEPVVQDAVREAVLFAKVVEKPRVVIHVEPEDERNFRVKVDASGVAEGITFSIPLTTRSRVKNATCMRCSRIQGGYYEAIVQIRIAKRVMEDDETRAIKKLASRFIERVVADGDRNAFVLRDEDIEGGLDIFMGTTNSGRMLAKAISTEWGGKIHEHFKLVGQKDGLDLVRMTFAVRLPEYRSGDVILIDEQPLLVSSVGAKTVQAVELRSGRMRHIERDLVERATVLPQTEARDAIVVSRQGDELQLLDPWNYATVSVIAPVGAEGETVRVLRHEGELIPIPMRKTESVTDVR